MDLDNLSTMRPNTTESKSRALSVFYPGGVIAKKREHAT